MKKNILQEESPAARMKRKQMKTACNNRPGHKWDPVLNKCVEKVEGQPEKKLEKKPSDLDEITKRYLSIRKQLDDNGIDIGKAPSAEDIENEPNVFDSDGIREWIAQLMEIAEKENFVIDLEDDIQDYSWDDEPEPKIDKPIEPSAPVGLKKLQNYSLEELAKLTPIQAKKVYSNLFGEEGDWSSGVEYENFSNRQKFYILRYFLGTPDEATDFLSEEKRFRKLQKEELLRIQGQEGLEQWESLFGSKGPLDNDAYDVYSFPVLILDNIPDGMSKKVYRRLQFQKYGIAQIIKNPNIVIPGLELPKIEEEEPDVIIEEVPELIDITSENDFRIKHGEDLDACNGPCNPDLQIRAQDRSPKDNVPDSPGAGIITYGGDDPLGAYSEASQYDLNDTMKEFFGLDSFSDYWRMNIKDLTKPHVVRRADGKIEETGPNTMKNGDVKISAPNWWPIHVGFAYKEYFKMYSDGVGGEYEFVLFQPDTESVQRARRASIKIKVELGNTDVANIGPGINKVITPKAKQALSKRIAHFGLTDGSELLDSVNIGGGDRSGKKHSGFDGVLQHGTYNPFYGIGNEAKKLISNLSTKQLDVTDHIDRHIRSPGGAPLYRNQNSDGQVTSVSAVREFREVRPGEKCEGACSVPLVAPEGFTGEALAIYTSFPVFIAVGEGDEKIQIDLGVPVLLPKGWREGKVFTRAEETLTKRLGIKLDHNYNFNFSTGKTNLQGIVNYADESSPYMINSRGGFMGVRVGEGEFLEGVNSAFWTGRQGIKPGEERPAADSDWMRIREYYSKRAYKPREYHKDALPEVIQKLETMNISDAARRWNTTWECPPTKNKCARVFTLPDGTDPTIGRGHAIQTRTDARLFRPYDLKGKLAKNFGSKPRGTKSLTQDQIEELKDYDIEISIQKFIKHLTIVPTQNQFDALFSKVYNSGMPKRVFKIITNLNKGNVGRAAKLFKHRSGVMRCPDGSERGCLSTEKTFIEIPGLTTRRNDEHLIFVTPDNDGFPNGSRSNHTGLGKSKPHWAGKFYGTRAQHMDSINKFSEQGSEYDEYDQEGTVIEPEAEKEKRRADRSEKIIEPVESLEDVKVLIYGHSQSHSGGESWGGRPGTAQRVALAEKNIIAKGTTHGVNDISLARKISKIKKDSNYTHAILHLDGNDWSLPPSKTARGDIEQYPVPNKEKSKRAIMSYVLGTLGIPEENIWVVVPPFNVDYSKRRKRRKNYEKRKESHLRAIEWFRTEYPNANVPDLVLAGKKSFDGDGYHMMGNSPESKKLANEIANQILQSVKINESITLNYILDLITEVTEKL